MSVLRLRCLTLIVVTLLAAVTAASAQDRGSPPGSDPRLRQFDPSTRMLIETELRNSTAAERNHWLNVLSEVEPSQAPHLLQARRRALAASAKELESRASEAAVPPPDSTSPPARIATQRVSPAPAIDSDPHTAPLRDISGPIGKMLPVGGVEPDLSPGVQPAGFSSGNQSPSTDRAPQEASMERAPEGETHLLRRAWMTPLKSFRGGDAPRETETPTQTASISAAPLAPPASASTAESRPSAFADAELNRLIALTRTEVDRLSAEGNAQNQSEYLQAGVRLRLLQLIAGQPEQAIQAIPGVPAAQQEFWTHQMWALANELDSAGAAGEAERIARTADLLDEAERKLRQQAPLQLQDVCFCHKINSFGNYERFSRSDFRPGQAVLLYAELKNFVSQLDRSGYYQTRLRTEIEIRLHGDEAAAPLDRRSFPATTDLCRSPRSDYFHSYRLELPSHLGPGDYLLRLTVIDELGQKSAVESLPFSVQ